MRYPQLENVRKYFSNVNKLRDGNPNIGTDGEIVELTDNKVAKVYREQLPPEFAVRAAINMQERYKYFVEILPYLTLPNMEFVVIGSASDAQVISIMDYIRGDTTSRLESHTLRDPHLVNQWNEICYSLFGLYIELYAKGLHPQGGVRLPILESGSGLWYSVRNENCFPFDEVPKSRNIILDRTNRIRLFDLGPLQYSSNESLSEFMVKEQFWNLGDDREKQFPGFDNYR